MIYNDWPNSLKACICAPEEDEIIIANIAKMNNIYFKKLYLLIKNKDIIRNTTITNVPTVKIRGTKFNSIILPTNRDPAVKISEK
nr:hypothetical protein [Sulfolobus islandicus]